MEAFAAGLFDGFFRADQRRWGQAYVRGLLLDGRRKSVEPMAARLGEDGNRQALAHFITSRACCESESHACSLRAQVPTRLGLRQLLQGSVRGAVGLDGESYLGTLLQRAVSRALAFHCPPHRRSHPLTGDGVEKG